MSGADILSGFKSGKFPLDFQGHWIDNEWHQSEVGDFRKDSLNPNDGSKVVTSSLGKKTIAKSIDSSEVFLKESDRLNKTERLELLQKIKTCLTDLRTDVVSAMEIELGKPQWEADLEFEATVHYLQWTIENEEDLFQAIAAPARIGCVDGKIGLLPIGITVGFLPFSTPLYTFMHYVSGCIVARTPLTLFVSGNATLTGSILTSILEKVEPPKGFINVLFGGFAAFRQTLTDKRVMAVLYTGSKEHCDIIRRESRSHLGRQLVLQSGGKNSVIVHSSADLELAVKVAAMGLIRGNGQFCTSTSWVFVYTNLMNDFCSALKTFVQNLKIGRTDLPDEEMPDIGPLYSKKAVEKFLRYQTMAHREAEEHLMWGEAVDRHGDGYFVTPGIHVMKEFNPKSAYQSNVLFGPHLNIYSYDVMETVIDQVNTTSSPFVVSFVGQEEILAERRYKFKAPNIMMNMPTVEMENLVPVAGRFNSGDYRYNGPGLAAILSYPQIVQNASEGSFLSKWTTKP